MLEVITHFPTAKPQSLFAPWMTITYASDIKIPGGEGDDLWEQKSEAENIAGEAISRLTIKPCDDDLYLHLWHGRNHLDNLEDWGFNGPCLGPLKQIDWDETGYQLIYPDGSEKKLYYVEDLLLCDGYLYGDVTATDQYQSYVPLPVSQIPTVHPVFVIYQVIQGHTTYWTGSTWGKLSEAYQYSPQERAGMSPLHNWQTLLSPHTGVEEIAAVLNCIHCNGTGEEHIDGHKTYCSYCLEAGSCPSCTAKVYLHESCRFHLPCPSCAFQTENDRLEER